MPAPPIRVCISSSCYPPAFGGQGIQYQSCLPALAECNLATTILTRRPIQSGELPEDPVPVHRVLTPGQGKGPNLRRVFEFRRHFREHGAEYDVLHSQITGWDFMWNLAYVKRMGIPVVVELILMGGDDLATMASSRFGASKLKILRDVDQWVVISKAFLPSLRDAGIPDDRVRVVYNGVDLDRYRVHDDSERLRLRQELDIPVDARVAISVGSVIERKGMDRVLRAWERLRPVPGRDLLIIAGPDTLESGLIPGDVEYAAALRREAESGALAKTVRFTGNTPRVQDYMTASDAFIFLSRHEGLGIVILEALASGLPCLLSPLDGIGRELIVEGETGFVLEDPDDTGAVARTLRTILDDPERRKQMGERCRRTAVERFSIESRARSLSALYHELAQKRVSAAVR